MNRTQMNTDFQDIKHKDLTEKIIRVFYEVYNRLGYGFLEKVYERAMMIEFKAEFWSSAEGQTQSIRQLSKIGLCVSE